MSKRSTVLDDPSQDHLRGTKEYDQGNVGYSAGQDCNPYGKGDRRVAWFVGWLDARTNDRLGDLFRRRGMTHP